MLTHRDDKLRNTFIYRRWWLATGIWHLASGIWHLASGDWQLFIVQKQMIILYKMTETPENLDITRVSEPLL